MDKPEMSVSACIPVGGRGERLRPLTNYCPKPLLPMGENRLVDFSISSLAPICQSMLFFTYYLSGQMEKYLLDHKRLSQNTRILRERKLLNIGGAFLQNYAVITQFSLGDNLIIAPGDHIDDGLDIDNLLKFHSDCHQPITIGLIPPLSYGDYTNLRSDSTVSQLGGGLVDDERLSYTGICVFNTNYFMDTLRSEIQAGWTNTQFDITKDIVSPNLAAGRVMGYVFTRGYWDDAGTPNRYHKNFLRAVGKDTYISPTSQATNCDIKHSVILGNCNLVNCRVENVIVASDVQLMNETIIAENENIRIVSN